MILNLEFFDSIKYNSDKRNTTRENLTIAMSNTNAETNILIHYKTILKKRIATFPYFKKK